MEETNANSLLNQIKDQYPDYPELYNLIDYMLYCKKRSILFSLNEELKRLDPTIDSLTALNKSEIENFISNTTDSSLDTLKTIIEKLFEYVENNNIFSYDSILYTAIFNCANNQKNTKTT
ncbi:hypothetical protein L3V83_05860 [Thiotrichales bacterium 19X7-9]|nr:hypothetical protein [Thiotrichales bacterium 19X7-9]